MPFTVIQGTFHVVGRSPDADSVGFRANDVDDWKKLAGPPPKLNGNQVTQLRFEAIDALETHYTPPGQHQSFHQPTALAHQATDQMLLALGITNVVWDQDHRLVLQANDGVPGYILSRAVEKNRRPVAFVFSGNDPGADGRSEFLDGDVLKTCVNFKLAQAGLVYPTYYRNLFFELRAEFTKAVQAARNSKLGVWAIDSSHSSATATIAALQDSQPIFPKLFRRLMEYMEGVDDRLALFDSFLEAKGDQLLILPKKQFTHFDEALKIDVPKNKVSLKGNLRPEDLVFEE
jgi:hypothetical protein